MSNPEDKNRKIWFSSDLHFGHANILKFLKQDGTPIRPGYTDNNGVFVEFKNIQHMNECLVQLHNELVSNDDIWYCFGDIGNVEIVNRMNGQKRLIMGNHDRNDIKVYSRYFKKIMADRTFNDLVSKELGFIGTHIPCHPMALGFKSKLNVHGHTHEKVVNDHNGKRDWRYVNICVEHTNCRPLSLDQLIERLKVHANRI